MLIVVNCRHSVSWGDLEERMSLDSAFSNCPKRTDRKIRQHHTTRRACGFAPSFWPFDSVLPAAQQARPASGIQQLATYMSYNLFYMFYIATYMSYNQTVTPLTALSVGLMRLACTLPLIDDWLIADAWSECPQACKPHAWMYLKDTKFDVRDGFGFAYRGKNQYVKNVSATNLPRSSESQWDDNHSGRKESSGPTPSIVKSRWWFMAKQPEPSNLLLLCCKTFGCLPYRCTLPMTTCAVHQSGGIHMGSG